MKLIPGLFCFFICCCLQPVNAQRQHDNWYFGKNAALSFPGGGSPVVKTDNAMNAYRVAACISHPVTGQLLFYTDGETVWNRNHVVMDNGTNITGVFKSLSAVIVPDPGNTNRYYIFCVTQNYLLAYAIADMTGDGGLGTVIQPLKYIHTNVLGTLTAAKHGAENAYWLIAHERGGNNKFLAYKITATGIVSTPVESEVGEPANSYGEFKTNGTGNLLVATHYAGNDGIAEVFDFNKVCGIVSNPLKLPKQPDWDYSYGIAFSKSNKYLYIAYSYLESQMVQYEVGNYINNAVVATNPQNFNDLQLTPDGKIYINTHDNGIPSARIDVIEQPENAGLASQYRYNVLNLGAGRLGNFEFPNFVNDVSPGVNGNTALFTINAVNTCIGDTVKFSYTGSITPDSVKWDFGDTTTNGDTSGTKTPSYQYNDTGRYTVTFTWYLCGQESKQEKKIDIIKPAPISLGPDTAFCFKDSITLFAGNGGVYLWNNGATTPTLSVSKPGRYWVQVTNGKCSGADTINISQRPPILIELGGDFSICDDDNELVKLDAGKGYDHYKWTPTGDTAQWIIVNKTGDYYVVVEDFRGCKGDDGTRVNRLCDFDFHLSTAFTPNGDGLNDVFLPVFSDIYDVRFEVYSRWGERVFASTSAAKGWDGSWKNQPCPAGAYLWKISFRGYQNKVLRNYNYKGSVQLLR